VTGKEAGHRAGLVIGEKFGRLANRLWLFAHVLGHAMEYGHQVRNPCLDEYCSFFLVGGSGLVPSYPQSKAHWRASPKARSAFHHVFSRVLERLKRRTNPSDRYAIVTSGVNDIYDLAQEHFRALASTKGYVILAGWRFRDYAAFDRHAAEIRRFFAPSRQIAQNVGRILECARDEAELLVGIHIRQSDYKDFLKGAYYFTLKEYVNIIRRTSDLFPGKKVRFLICSDEPQDPRQFVDIDFRMGSGHPVEDLMSFAGCDYIVGPPSTYTMWASFYGQVPLCVLRDASATFSLDSFEIIGGRFDIGADVV
jgi:hypothetical protein